MSPSKVMGTSQHGHRPPLPSRRQKVRQSWQYWVPRRRAWQSGHSYTVVSRRERPAGRGGGEGALWWRWRQPAWRQASEHHRLAWPGSGPPQAPQVAVTQPLRDGIGGHGRLAGSHGDERPVDVSGHVALEAANNLRFRSALGG